jgi:hypothetical protein
MYSTLTLHIPVTRETLKAWASVVIDMHARLKAGEEGFVALSFKIEDVPPEEVEEVQDLLDCNVSGIVVAFLEERTSENRGGSL